MASGKSRSWYVIYTENGKFMARAENAFSAWFKALMLGYRSYIDLNPQRVVVERWCQSVVME